MTTLDLRRQFFAEELEAVCRLRSPQLVKAFAMVPREQFLGPGPWMVLSENPYMAAATSFGGTGLGLRETPDADPGRVYHNIAVAIDPARQLFNGQPGTLCGLARYAGFAPGARVLHVGAGLGYYTAVIAQAVGPSGCLRSNRNSAGPPPPRRKLCVGSLGGVWGRRPSLAAGRDIRRVVVNAGVTHPLDAGSTPGSRGRMLCRSRRRCRRWDRRWGRGSRSC